MDQTGGVLPTAELTLQNIDTGFTRTTRTNNAGAYSFAELPVGTYNLEAGFAGFKSAVLSNIQLNVADVREIQVKLEAGTVAETVTVEAAAVAVKTIGGEVAGLVTGEQVRELPLNGRNFVQLTQLMPGVSAPDGLNTKNKGLLTGVDLSVSGSPVTANLWMVDGANNNDVGSNRTILVYPSVEAIEEFKIHRNSYGAEFGGASGAQVNVVTRSGQNEFHGSTYYFRRDDSWNSKNFFLKRAGQEKEALNRNDFGFTLGGPIVKDKLHFFASQEWNREERGTVRQGFVPTAAERAGDFSGPRIAGCTPPIPVDPATGQPFPGNVIPPSRISPGGRVLLDLYPLPNTTPVAGTCNNWVASVDTSIRYRQESLRLDWQASSRSRLMVRYTQDTWKNLAPNAGEANGLWGDDAFPAVDSTWEQPGKSLVVQLNQTIGSTAVNTLQFSYSGNRIDIGRGGTQGDLNSRINAAIPTIFADKTGGADRSHPVFWGSQGYAAVWNIAPWDNKQDLFVLKDDYSQVFGNHFVKVGALFSYNKKEERIQGSSAAESPHFWGGAGLNGWGATTGNIVSDLLLRDMTHGFDELSFEPRPALRWKDLEFYVADSWKFHPRATLDVGVRYSRFTPPYEADGLISAFSPEAYDPALGNDPCNGLLVVPGTNPCQTAGFRGGTPGPGSGLVEGKNLFAPRLGFAWDVFGDGKTAVRAGVGRFYLRDRVNIQLDFAGNPPFTRQRNGIRKLDTAAEPCAGCYATSLGVPNRGIAVDGEVPHNWQWNVMLQQELGRNTTLELGYVGNKGVDLTRRVDVNQVRAGDANGNGLSDRLEFVRLEGNDGARGALRPFPAWGNNRILFWQHDGSSIYHSLQAQFVTRFARGSQFQASYTWSRLIADDTLADGGAGEFAGQISDLDNPGLDRGLAEIHREHVFNASLVYTTPKLQDKGTFVKNVFGDWQVGIIAIASSGTALTVYTGGIPGLGGGLAGTGYNDNVRPIRVPGQPCRASGGVEEQWLNPDAFTLAGYRLGTFGDSGRGVCTGPGFFQLDLSLFKNIQIGKRVRAQLRFEVFNVFNRVNFTNVANNLGPINVTYDAPLGQATAVTGFSPSLGFGQATRTRDPRQVQVGVKLIF